MCEEGTQGEGAPSSAESPSTSQADDPASDKEEGEEEEVIEVSDQEGEEAATEAEAQAPTAQRVALSASATRELLRQARCAPGCNSNLFGLENLPAKRRRI